MRQGDQARADHLVEAVIEDLETTFSRQAMCEIAWTWPCPHLAEWRLMPKCGHIALICPVHRALFRRPLVPRRFRCDCDVVSRPREQRWTRL